ncbi:peptidylprolyl isomerase [uncultured Dokdonia sp.]|uniref:peptidylprolyl isomerase n=1 Tax=uncultured Dokdonia sp. TaxID=575653 RepID=UPI0026269FF1|nr:peptidylprolyl isomerase [uncultured Dokdonia sp.]
MKFIIKTLVLLLLCQPLFAQDGNTDPKTKFKVDGVAGVVGDYLILESDIDKFLFDIKSQGQSSVDVTPCQVMGKLLEDKLLAHHAIQDSIIVNDAQVNSEVDQIIDRFAQQLGSLQKVIEYYKKDNIAELRAELFSIRRDIRLSESMNEKIISSVDVTPDEVKSFFESIPENELPTFGVELEIAQIVVQPKPTDQERQRVIDRLNGFRSDIIDNGSSFATKAVLYTDDGASRGDGGFMTIDRKTPLVKEFRDVVFGLQEGEVSEPFETEYGFHIATLEKIRGDKLEIRHILLIPEIDKAQEEDAKDKIERIKQRIEQGELTFDNAAREFSDQKETKFDGGVLTNPVTLDKRFELNKLDPTLYTKVNNLKDGEVSLVFNDPDRTGKSQYKIVTVNSRLEEHKADYSKDYIKIKELALREKQIKAISEWQKEKIEETYIKVNGDNRDCEYVNNWLKK